MFAYVTFEIVDFGMKCRKGGLHVLVDIWKVSLAAYHSPLQKPLPETYNMENGPKTQPNNLVGMRFV